VPFLFCLILPPDSYDFAVALRFWPLPSKLQLVQCEMTEIALTPHCKVFSISGTFY
jgi:hypothetical protein